MIDIAMDGPMIDGTWYNYQTGDQFTVRDSFFQDGQLMIQATDGRMFDYNTIQNYVKGSNQSNPNQPTPSTPQPQKPQSLPNEVESLLEDYMIEEDKTMLVSPQRPQTTTPTPQPTLSEDEIIINRILSRVQEPIVHTNTIWSNFPIKQFDMLIDMMGVDVESIAKYFVNKIDFDELKKTLAEEISHYILRNMKINTLTPQESSLEPTNPTKASTKKTTPKTSKKK